MENQVEKTYQSLVRYTDVQFENVTSVVCARCCGNCETKAGIKDDGNMCMGLSLVIRPIKKYHKTERVKMGVISKEEGKSRCTEIVTVPPETELLLSSTEEESGAEEERNDVVNNPTTEGDAPPASTEPLFFVRHPKRDETIITNKTGGQQLRARRINSTRKEREQRNCLGQSTFEKNPYTLDRVRPLLNAVVSVVAAIKKFGPDSREAYCYFFSNFDLVSSGANANTPRFVCNKVDKGSPPASVVCRYCVQSLMHCTTGTAPNEASPRHNNEILLLIQTFTESLMAFSCLKSPHTLNRIWQGVVVPLYAKKEKSMTKSIGKTLVEWQVKKQNFRSGVMSVINIASLTKNCISWRINHFLRNHNVVIAGSFLYSRPLNEQKGKKTRRVAVPIMPCHEATWTGLPVIDSWVDGKPKVISHNCPVYALGVDTRRGRNGVGIGVVPSCMAKLYHALLKVPELGRLLRGANLALPEGGAVPTIARIVERQGGKLCQFKVRSLPSADCGLADVLGFDSGTSLEAAHPDLGRMSAKIIGKCQEIAGLDIVKVDGKPAGKRYVELRYSHREVATLVVNLPSDKKGDLFKGERYLEVPHTDLNPSILEALSDNGHFVLKVTAPITPGGLWLTGYAEFPLQSSDPADWMDGRGGIRVDGEVLKTEGSAIPYLLRSPQMKTPRSKKPNVLRSHLQAKRFNRRLEGSWFFIPSGDLLVTPATMAQAGTGTTNTTGTAHLELLIFFEKKVPSGKEERTLNQCFARKPVESAFGVREAYYFGAVQTDYPIPCVGLPEDKYIVYKGTGNVTYSVQHPFATKDDYELKAAPLVRFKKDETETRRPKTPTTAEATKGNRVKKRKTDNIPFFEPCAEYLTWCTEAHLNFADCFIF